MAAALSDVATGSVVSLKDAVARLATTELSLSESLRLATQNPARVLGRSGKLQVGAPGDLIRFTWEPAGGFQIESTLLQGTPV